MKNVTSEITLEKLLNYCLGYIKLINPSFSRYKVYTDPIDLSILDPQFIFSLDPNENSTLNLNMKEFYTLNPKELSEETEEEYLKQKTLATKLEEIKNKYKVDEYTKQVNLNFGYFKIEIPENKDLEDEESTNENIKVKEDIYPLFSIPIEIKVSNGKYTLEILDFNIIPNIGFLQAILGEDVYFDFSSFITHLENEGRLALPLSEVIVTNVWEELKAKLRLSDAQFDEKSFDIHRMVVSLSSKSNYFLSQDLKALTEMNEEELIETSLGSWISNEGLAINEEVEEEGGELFFPFDYDKYQLKALSIINNKASIVQGPPGTGKSQTIANLLSHLAAQNKRVLFLSQKAQAIKVVKDKLKQLDIDYLYGYIPNRFSNVYNQDEERDGASYTLTGLNEYIHFIHDRKIEESHIDQEGVSEGIDLFNNSIEQERKFYELQNELQKLQEYNIEIPYEEKFLERFSEKELLNLAEMKNQSNELSKFCGEYIKNNNGIDKLEKRFELISFENSDYSEIFEKLIAKVKAHGWDRPNPIGNWISDRILLLRVRDTTRSLPREILDGRFSDRVPRL